MQTDPWDERGEPAWRHNANDASNEKRCADYLTAKWACLFHPFARGSPVDWWLERRNRVVGIAELKTSFKERDYAILNLRKFSRLLTIAEGFNVPAIFIHQQPSGEIFWVDIALANPQPKAGISACIIGKPGTRANSREPALRIELTAMNKA